MLSHMLIIVLFHNFVFQATRALALLLILECMDLTTGAPLQIDYSSLADVRIIKYGNGNMNVAKPVSNGVCQASSLRPISNEATKTPTKGMDKIYMQGIKFFHMV